LTGFDEKGKPYLRVKMDKVQRTGDIDRKKQQNKLKGASHRNIHFVKYSGALHL
jgi:hypothetical protein